MTYIPTEYTLAGVPAIDDRGRVTLKKWLQAAARYSAHVFSDGSILLKVVGK